MRENLSEYCVRYIAKKQRHTVEVSGVDGGIKAVIGGDVNGIVQFHSHGMYKTDVNWDWLLSVYAESYKFIPQNI